MFRKDESYISDVVRVRTSVLYYYLLTVLGRNAISKLWGFICGGFVHCSCEEIVKMNSIWKTEIKNI